jgi:penicillin amidase
MTGRLPFSPFIRSVKVVLSPQHGSCCEAGTPVKTQTHLLLFLYEVWYSRHLRRAIKDVVLRPPAAAVIDSPNLLVLLDSLKHPEQYFADNASAKRDALLLSTLRDAYEDAEKLAGPDPKQWKWGNVHQNFGEQPFSAVLDEQTRTNLNAGPLAQAGSEFTPNRASYRTNDFRVTVGPTIRVVIDATIYVRSTIQGSPRIPIARTTATWLRCGNGANTSPALYA